MSWSAIGVQELSCTAVINGSPHTTLPRQRLRRRLSVAAAAAVNPGSNWGDNSVFKVEVSDPCSSSSENSSLIALCEDLDWEACVDALRREAAAALVRRDQIEALRSKSQGINKDEWDFNQAISELRKQASLQAAEHLVKRMDVGADIDAAVAKLADQIFISACKMSGDQGEDGNGSTGLSTKAAGVVVSILAGIQGWALANAEEAPSVAAQATEVAAAASKVPSWLGAALLGFPVAGYLVFNVYRDKVNKDASIMDFLFAMAAMLIVGNIVTSATLGVRLY